jgi:hypothetical protein
MVQPTILLQIHANQTVGAGSSVRRIAAMVVNDNACEPDKRGALEPIAGRLLQTRSLVGAGLPAMVVNDNAGELDDRGALESIASRLAPTDAVSIGAGLPAMVVNDNACEPDKRGALEPIAGKPAPTRPHYLDVFREQARSYRLINARCTPT